MSKKLKYTASYEYMGEVIFRIVHPGGHLKYEASVHDGQRLAADTLAGIKSMIRARKVKP